MLRITPRQSAKVISSLSEHVTISHSGIQRVADLLEKPFLNQEYSIKKWKQHKLNPKTMDQTAVDWIFLVDTLNFSFWNDREHNRCQIEFGGEYYTGYWALCAAVNKAMQKGLPICQAQYWVNIDSQQLAKILCPDLGDEMPLLENRCTVLRETGKILIQKYQGTFVNAILQSQQSAKKLLELIVENFPSYRDEAIYKNHKVCFYKRAQILIADIWACCEGRGLGTFNDIETLTVFADYRIPQILLHLGALKYSEELMHDLINKKELENGSQKEIEIRGCTILAAEMILEEMHKRIKEKIIINSILVDYFLWDYNRDHRKEINDVPFHRTRCIYY